MNKFYDKDENQRISDARNSFSGRLLTENQFSDAIHITNIIENEIYNTGTFKEKLADYAYAFARTEKFDVVKAETTLRDLFKERTGQTMNQLRESLMDREDEIEDGGAEDSAKEATRAIHSMIKDGDKVSFHRAYDYQASLMAGVWGITNLGAKRIICETFRKQAEGELYDWGKDLEDKYYRPQIEAEKAERQQRKQSKKQAYTANDDGGDTPQPIRRSRARQPA